MPTLILLIIFAVIALIIFIIKVATGKVKIVNILNRQKIKDNEEVEKLIQRLSDVKNIKKIDRLYVTFTDKTNIYIGEGKDGMFGNESLSTVNIKPNEFQKGLIWELINQQKQKFNQL